MALRFYSEITEDQNFASMLDGQAYRWFDFGTLLPEESKDFLIYIPPAPVELLFYGRLLHGRGSDANLMVYVNPVFSAQGSSMQGRIFNRSSDYPSNNQAMIWQNPTITSEGDLSDYDEVFGELSTGSGNKGSSGSETTQEFPRVMPKDTYLLSRLTNLSTTNNLNFIYKLFWSEIKG